MGDKSPKSKDKAKKQTAVVKGQKQSDAAKKLAVSRSPAPAAKKK
jgi:hypothetical protein